MYPTLRRPKRKLCYITDNESPPELLGGALTLEEEVDRLFDDIDSDSCAPLHPLSPLLQNCDAVTNPSQTEISPVPQQNSPAEILPGLQKDHEDVQHATLELESPKLDIDLDIPFKAHGPVKTSSPIEQNMGADGVEKHEKGQVVLPNCVDEIAEEPCEDPLPTQKPQCNGEVAEECDGDELESPPSRITITKMPSHKVKANVLCRQSSEEAPGPAVGQESGPPASENKRPPAETSTHHVGKDVTAFMEKLKLAAKPQSTCFKKSLIKAAPAPPSPEPVEDFFILEDDSPLWFTIPSKSATNRRQKQSKTSSTDKESSTDTGAKVSPLESPQDPPELVTGNAEQESETVDQKIKKRKGKQHKVMGLGNDEDALPSPRDLPASDLMELHKPKRKKQQLKKVPSKDIDEVEDQPKDMSNVEKGKEKPLLEAKTKSHKPSARKNSRESKEDIKTSRANTLKEVRKKHQGRDAAKDVPHLDVKEPSPQPADAEDLASSADEKVTKSKVDERNTANKHPAGPGEGSSGESEDLGKRKRKQTGQWWLSCPQSTEETQSWQPTPKKSKQPSKDSKAAVISPVKTKKGNINKRKTTQKSPVKLSSEHTGKERKSKQTKKKPTREATPDRMKAADEIPNTSAAEQEQQEIPDQQQSSPLVFAHRDLSTDSGQIFQKVYHHNIKPRSPRPPRQELVEAESGKRSRSQPGNWWTVNNMAEDLKSILSPPQQLPPKEPKPQQDKKKTSKQRKPAGLGVPKTGNMVVPSKPPGGAQTPLKPLSAPKTVKRSLATFKDIFSSGIVTPNVVSNRDAHQSSRCYITSHPAEVSATASRADKDALSRDAGGCRGTLVCQETPQDKEGPSENTRLEALRSGPSSMIQLEQYEDNDDIILPSSRVQAMLAVSDLSAPPLKPLSLHPKDKAALSEWFQSLWSPSANDGAAVTPDQFDWYSYKDRALGIQADLNSGSICSGKILLGSHMKKPLWVDHSATTVFNLLTSSVSVTVNGSVSRYRPGQTFLVECGSAYSIHNSSAQPAVLFFTRMLMESSD